jgi:hypothetical protein
MQKFSARGLYPAKLVVRRAAGGYWGGKVRARVAPADTLELKLKIAKV